MSHAPIEVIENEDTERYNKELADVYYMLRFGRAWSGREKNCCFLNTGQGKFADVSYVAGLDYIDDSRAIACVDWDFDGDVDMWMSNRTGPKLRFLRNELESDNHFVSIRLQGNGTTTNRDAIGARVEVVTADQSRRFVKSLCGGRGYISQSSKWLTFGLGDIDKIEKVTVRWPAGETETFENIKVDGWYRLVQDSGKAKSWTPPKRKLALEPSPMKVPSSVGPKRTFFAGRIPAPLFEYEDFDGLSNKIDYGNGPTLLTIFASWCTVCAEEIKEMSEREDDLRQAGISPVLLTIDPVSDTGKANPTEKIAAMLDRLKYPFATGLASSETVARLEFLHDAVFPFHEKVATPWSVLIDRDGRLAAFYIGRVDIDQLVKDVKNIDAGPAKRMHLASPGKGKWYAPHVDVNLPEVAKAYYESDFLEDAAVIYQQLAEDEETAVGANYYLGVIRQKQQRWEEAIEHYLKTLDDKPDYSAYHNLALVCDRLDRHDDAIQYFTKACELAPDNAQVAYSFANLLIDLKKGTEAEKQLRSVIKIQPDHIEAIVRLGGLLVEQGRATEAITIYSRSLSELPDLASLAKARLLNGTGMALISQNKLKESIESFEKALEESPTFEAAKQNLERIQQRLEPKE